MLENLHHTIRVLTQASGAMQADILMLRTRFPFLPETVSALMLDATELELSYGGRYLRLYGPHGCMEMDDAYGISNAIPGAIPIGDNGGGEAIVIVNNAVYRVGYGALAPDELTCVAESIEDLLLRAIPEPDSIGACLAES
ncbi:MAG: hypothetical protein JSS02_27415 [Planctomycetes bacterium]|nr:hypothetical protein [Planctomycetota bacterium]